jgi:REP element-mobilizing transposase RayT
MPPSHPNQEPPSPNPSANENPGILGEHKSSSLCNVTAWFKTMVTNEYIRNVKSAGWPRFSNKLWQRNYYEHIIRDQKGYERIVLYLVHNPENWAQDMLRH